MHDDDVESAYLCEGKRDISMHAYILNEPVNFWFRFVHGVWAFFDRTAMWECSWGRVLHKLITLLMLDNWVHKKAAQLGFRCVIWTPNKGGRGESEKGLFVGAAEINLWWCPPCRHFITFHQRRKNSASPPPSTIKHQILFSPENVGLFSYVSPSIFSFILW